MRTGRDSSAVLNGEFVGGSDIMTEMYQAGELQQTLGTTA